MQGAMALLGWSQADKLELVPLNANRFLKMMSQVAVGWLLLEQGVIASGKLEKLSATDPDRAFFEGKVHAANWFARNVIPEVELGAKLMALEDTSPVQISDEAFATV
jgi:hypothetical protein